MITYNHESYIRQAIESVLSQKTNFGFEIVIGEDCSTDGTRAIVLEYAEKYPDQIVALLPKANQGWVSNFEQTRRQCRGEFIAMLEGDDHWIHEGKLQMQADFLRDNPGCSLCYTRVRRFDDQQTEPDTILPVVKVKRFSTIKDILARQFIQTCSVTVRASSLEPTPVWFEGLALGDWPMFILAARHGSLGFIDEVTAAYRVHPGGIWSGKDPVFMCRQIIRMFERLLANLDRRYRAWTKAALSREYFELAWRLRDQGKHLGARKAIAKCVAIKPINPLLSKPRVAALWMQYHANPIYRAANGFRTL